jgi:hypothetical protein
MPANTPSLAAIPGIQVQVGNTTCIREDETTVATVDGQFVEACTDVGPGAGCVLSGQPTTVLPYFDTAGPNGLTGLRFNGGASGQTAFQQGLYNGNDTDFFCAMIVSLDASQPTGARLLERGGTSTGTSLVVDSTGRVITFYLLTTGYFANNLTLPDNNPHLVWVARTGSTVKMGFDGETPANMVSFTAVSTAISGNPYIWLGGKYTGGTPTVDSLLAGKMYSFTWVSAYPSDDNRRRIYDWNHNISGLTFTDLPGVPSGGSTVFRRGNSSRAGSRAARRLLGSL